MIKRKFGYLASVLATALFLSTSINLQNSYALATPTNVSAKGSVNAPYLNASITITWDFVAGSTQYAALVTRAGTNTESSISVSGERNTQAVISGLIGGVTYVVQVRAVQGIDVSEWSSNSLTVTPTTLPKAPSKPTVTAGVGSATISWNAISPSDDGGSDITSYIVTEKLSGKTITASASATSAEFTGLAQGATASFTVTSVTAVSATGNTSPVSDEVTILTADGIVADPTPTASSSAVAAPTSTPTPSPTSSGGGGFFGGGGGGGFFGGAIEETTTASASPTPSPSASLSPSPKPSPSPIPSLTPKPSPSPTSQVVVRSSSGLVVKTNLFQVPSKIAGPVTSNVIAKAAVTLVASTKIPVQPVIPKISKGTEIKVVVKGSDGKSYTIASTKTKTSGTYIAPPLKFSKPGTYTVTILVGKVRKIVTYKVK